MSRPGAGDREALVRAAVRLELFTLAWTVIEAGAALWFGIAARSLALVGFGLDSAMETVAATMVYYRWRAEQQGSESAEQMDRAALRVIGFTFLLLAGYIAYEGVSGLVTRSRPDATLAGIAVSAMALIVMVALGRSKRRVGRLLKSNALLADSVETFVCAYLSAIVLVGLGLNAIWSWWWADPVAALAICPFLLKEAVEALRGEEHDER